MKEVIIEAETIEKFCGLATNTTNAEDIKFPIFITDTVQDAQGRALDVKTGQNEGWVYRITVNNARYRQITNRLSILLDGEIRLDEIIYVRRDADGQIERLYRTKI